MTFSWLCNARSCAGLKESTQSNWFIGGSRGLTIFRSMCRRRSLGRRRGVSWCSPSYRYIFGGVGIQLENWCVRVQLACEHRLWYGHLCRGRVRRPHISLASHRCHSYERPCSSTTVLRHCRGLPATADEIMTKLYPPACQIRDAKLITDLSDTAQLQCTGSIGQVLAVKLGY